MTGGSSVDISFIIPAFNEEKSIAVTLQCILDGEFDFPFEIIVVDHDSTDRTVAVASDLGATVIHKKGGTIAGVRNYGVQKSNGNLLVFLDADVSLTEQWFDIFAGVVQQIRRKPMIVTGSHCNAPENGNWIERYWFNNYVHEADTSNLGTGHMITSRQLFEAIDGFDDTLETGEDYSFCMKVLKHGGEIISNPGLYVVHRDYPDSSWKFIQREAWHGMGDVASLSAVLQSKVALASLVFMSLHMLSLLAMFVQAIPVFVLPLSLVAIAGLLVFSSWKKYKHCSCSVILINSAVFYLYFFGRSLSFVKAISARLSRPRI